MILKRTAASKRAPAPRASDHARSFVKDSERHSRSGRYDMHRVKAAMLSLIANDAPLGPEWLDHPLRGEWDDQRECHVGGDFLLIYQIEGNFINFVRAGSHADLFNE